MITVDQDNLKRKGKGYLAKLRSNFLGTEFVVYDDGEAPEKKKNMLPNEVRNEVGSIVYVSQYNNS
jgi:tubby-related protein 1